MQIAPPAVNHRSVAASSVLALSVTFLFVCESNISGTAERICAKFTGRRVWSLARTSLNVKVKGQGHQEQKCDVHSYHLPHGSDGMVPSAAGHYFAASTLQISGLHAVYVCRNIFNLYLLWSPYGIGQTIIFASCRLFFLLFLFPHLISAVADWMSAILPHMVWP